MMHSTPTLPLYYEQDSTIDLAKDKTLLINLTIASLALFFVFGGIFTILAGVISPALTRSGSIAIDLPTLLLALVAISAITVLVMVVHEFIHGLFFWTFTHSKPEYGFKGVYAYAAAPDWYIPRNQFLVIGLAPLIILTLLGLVLLRFLPSPGVVMVVFGMTLNAAGAVGDIFIVGLALRKPASCLFRDFGTGITLYRKQPTQH
jgi:hypothetical protein